MNLARLVERAQAFYDEGAQILARAETSPDRVITLEQTYRQLSDISVKQEILFTEALRCIRAQCYRAAHVIAWAGFVDFVHCKLCEDGCKKLQIARPKWKIRSPEDLRECVDAQVIDTLKLVGLCGKGEVNALHALRNKRNECAHPEEHSPGLNESLGYVSDVLQRLERLSKHKL